MNRSISLLAFAFLLLGTVAGPARTYFYDEAGRLVRVAYPQGKGVEYEYDAADNLTGVHPLVLPIAPQDLEVERVSDNEARLTWQDLASIESSYVIMRRLATDLRWQEVATVSRNVTTYTDSPLVAGLNYVYRVAAVSAEGSSAYSNESTAAGGGGEPFRIALFGRQSESAQSRRFRITFQTLPDTNYRLQAGGDLTTWNAFPFATTPAGAPTANTLAGIGAEITIYIEVPRETEESYFRLLAE